MPAKLKNIFVTSKSQQNITEIEDSPSDIEAAAKAIKDITKVPEKDTRLRWIRRCELSSASWGNCYEVVEN